MSMLSAGQAGDTSIALLPKAQEAFSRTAAEAIRRLQEKNAELEGENATVSRAGRARGRRGSARSPRAASAPKRGPRCPGRPPAPAPPGAAPVPGRAPPRLLTLPTRARTEPDDGGPRPPPQVKREVKRMRALLLEMQGALQATVDENEELKRRAAHAEHLERRLGDTAGAKAAADEACREQAEELAALRAARDSAERRARVSQGEAQAALAEATTLRDALARGAAEMEAASRLAQESLKRANGEAQARRDVTRSLRRVEGTLRSVLDFSSGLVESMSDSLLRGAAGPGPSDVLHPGAPVILQPTLGLPAPQAGLARLGAARRAQRGGPATTSGRHAGAPPAGTLAGAAGALRGRRAGAARADAAPPARPAPGAKESVRAVLASLEDELAVLDSKHAGLLQEAQDVAERLGRREGDADPELSAEAEALRAALDATQRAMDAKGAQVQQLEGYLRVL